MILFAELIGLIVTAVGMAVALRPAVAGMALEFWERDKRFYLGAILRIAFAGIFFFAAEDSIYPLALQAISLLVLISGVLCLVMPETKVLKLLGWAKTRPAIAVRIWGGTVALLGSLIVYLTY